jgi:hypothetical protein
MQAVCIVNKFEIVEYRLSAIMSVIERKTILRLSHPLLKG